MILLLPTRFWFSAISIYPFIIMRRNDYSITLLNHEYIHNRQQRECLIIFAYLFYIVEFLCKLLYYRSVSKAYRNISFEREAKLFEKVVGYAGRRKSYNWLKFVYVKDKRYIK